MSRRTERNGLRFGEGRWRRPQVGNLPYKALVRLRGDK